MAQTIIPVTMSIVQKELYKSILLKNATLIQAIFSKAGGVVKKTDRGNLNNILMQLRKCLCHPYLYNEKIEDRSLDSNAQTRAFIGAASKFQLLEIMLPKLRDRGRRVLLFSQFLENLTLIEDFLHHLGLRYQRLDGKIDSLEKQRRIDQFNAPNSELFAFLLSTRAGGVGINLATADTVIIMVSSLHPL
jgi:chromodomain-helicase-DNA-binding protein 4